MPEFADTYGPVPKNGTVTLLDRAVGWGGSEITQSDISAVEYSIYLLDPNDADSREVVTGHDGESLNVADVIYDTLQTDGTWTEDSDGYNFAHTPEVDTNDAFTIAGREYLVEYWLTPASGQAFPLRFRLNCI